jgi:drug/metabolite transporter (DMT)-like permease
VLLAAVGYAVAPQIAARSLSEVPALPLTAACLLFTALLSAPFAAFSWPREVPATAALGSLLGLGVLCTAVAFLLFFRLIAEAGPARATAIAYVNPVVALALGVALHGDPFTPVIAAGSVLVLLGTVLATRGPGATAGAQIERGGEAAGSAAGERSRVPENTALD